jgi:hypothetical protein
MSYREVSETSVGTEMKKNGLYRLLLHIECYPIQIRRANAYVNYTLFQCILRKERTAEVS